MALYELLDNEVRLRDWSEGQSAMDEMADLYEGRLPRQYEKFFPKDTPKHLVQLVNLAWDDLANQAGRVPDLRGEPRNQTRKELKRIGLLQKIGFWYIRQAKPSGKVFMKVLAWWLLAGRAVAIVEPDFEEGMPRLSLRDPRTCYPGIKESLGNQIIELDDLIFKYELSRPEAIRRGLATSGGTDDEKDNVTIIEFIDKTKWCIASEDGPTHVAYHNLGKVPGWVFQLFSPNSKQGKSMFKDQVSLMVAVSRLITAKMAFADRLLHPIMWAKGHEGEVEIGPYVINKLGPQGEMGQLNPPIQMQVDQDIQLLTQFSRVLNRNTEVRQGEVQAKGQYVSAKTLETLAEAIDSAIQGLWDVISPGMEKLLEVCFIMDEMYWPDEEKSIQGFVKGSGFMDQYTPTEDIDGMHRLAVDYGFGLGGYQGFLMHVQAKEAGLMSRRRAMEAMPGQSDVDEALREMEIEAMDDAGLALFASQAASGQLDMVLWAQLRNEMAEKGSPLHEVITKYQEAIMAQAAAVQEQAAPDVTGLSTPAEEEVVEEEPGGIPPELLMGV
jgi:hypothetical protein